jgi:hypothetical protein
MIRRRVFHLLITTGCVLVFARLAYAGPGDIHSVVEGLNQ